VDHVEVPQCAPMALVHYRHPTSSSDWLFVAGGSNGLWRVELCSDLFEAPAAACSGYTTEQVDIVETTNFERKVCVDVAIVDGNSAAGEALVCAIYAAREDADASVG